MKNFVLLYTGGTIPESEEDQAAVMAAWGAWYGQMGEAVVDGGNPFSVSKSITANGVEDCVIAPNVTGYTVISAEDMDGALAACAAHPHLSYGGQVTVHETFQM